MVEWLTEPLTYGFAARGLLAGLLAALSCAALSAFVVWRGMAFIGDAVAHSILPGIVLAFMLTGAKTPLVLVLGAALAGWTASLLVMLVVRTSRIKLDTALGLVLSTFFGLGLVLLSVVQRSAGAGQAARSLMYSSRSVQHSS